MFKKGKPYKVVSEHSYTFYCKNCKKQTSTIYKDGEDTYCDKCVPLELKNKSKTINQNREEV